MKFEFFTSSPSKTKRAGALLAQEVLRSKNSKKAKVIGLVGDLGGGKTTFLQGFAKGLGIKQRITSPTFVIMKRVKNFYHIDCYRIKKSTDLLSLGFKDIISDPKNIVAVEWADRAIGLMPKNTVWVSFEFINEKTRRIVVK